LDRREQPFVPGAAGFILGASAPERDEHRVSAELDAVDEHRDQVDVVQLARDELRELLGGGLDQRSRGVRLDCRTPSLRPRCFGRGSVP
jgi:hypothetical protein